MNPPPRSSIDLALFRARDPSTLHAVVESYLDPVFAFVFHRVDRNRTLAEEVVQDTFLAAVQQAPAFRGESALFSWLCAIARNQILLRRRQKMQGRRPVSFSDLVLDADQEVLAAIERIEEEDLPDQIVEREETRRFVGAVMSTLPPAYQQGLLARYRDGKSLEQMAADNQTTSKAAESLLYRARRAFAEAFRVFGDRVSATRRDDRGAHPKGAGRAAPGGSGRGGGPQR